MKTKIISKIQNQMKPYLNQGQYLKLTNSLLTSLQDIDIVDNNNDLSEVDNFKLLNLFLSAKQVEGCSEKTIIYYKSAPRTTYALCKRRSRLRKDKVGYLGESRD